MKDIIDVEGLPTRANSRSRADIEPAAADAEVVLALKAQGAVILGKVHTTEFAFFDPSPARNPYNLAHTPGGSSSGSAAAVAAGMAPVAIGTQTVASVNRPAADCGIAAYKPSSRSLSTFGITPLAPSYDTAGFYGWSVDDAVLAFEAAAPASMGLGAGPGTKEKLSITIPEDEHTSEAMSMEMRAAHARVGGGSSRPRAISRARALADLRLRGWHALQRSTMLYETGRALRTLLDAPAGSVGEKLTTAIREGLEIAGQPLSRRARRDRRHAHGVLRNAESRRLALAGGTDDGAGRPRLDGRAQVHRAVDGAGRPGRDDARRAGVERLAAGRYRREPAGQRCRDVSVGPAAG